MRGRNERNRNATRISLQVNAIDLTLKAHTTFVISPQRSISSALAVPSAKLTGASCELTVAAVLLTGLYGASGQWALDRYRILHEIEDILEAKRILIFSCF